MKPISIVLFFFGMAIQLAALFVEHAEEIPFALKAIAPQYYHARLGLAAMRGGKPLTSKDEGFSEISSILLAGFRQRNHVRPTISDLSVDRVWIKVNFEQGGDGIDEFSDIDFNIETKTTIVYGPGGHTGAVSLRSLQASIEALKGNRVLYFCLAIFALGSLIETVAFFAESTESNSGGVRPENQHIEAVVGERSM